MTKPVEQTQTNPVPDSAEFDPEFLKSIQDAEGMSLEDALGGSPEAEKAAAPPPPPADPAITKRLARIVAYLTALDIPADLREQVAEDVSKNELIEFLLNEILDFPGAFAAVGGTGAQNLHPMVRVVGGVLVIAGIAFMTKQAYAPGKVIADGQSPQDFKAPEPPAAPSSGPRYSNLSDTILSGFSEEDSPSA